MTTNTLSTFTTTRSLMFKEIKMLKHKTFKSGTETRQQDRDGELSTLTLHKIRPRDSIRTLDL